MNYYPHHLGDYAKDTSHLTMIEDGAYRRLLDLYYSTEAPLPLDMDALCRLVRARGKAERSIVKAILLEFFNETDAGWSHERCDKELATAKVKAEAARNNGRLGGRPRTQEEPNNNPVGFQNITQQEPSEKLPITNSQEPITKNQVKASRKRELPMPPDFSITERVRKWAASKGITRLEAHFENFVSQCKAKGYTYADWDEGFMGAVRKDWARLGVGGNPQENVI